MPLSGEELDLMHAPIARRLSSHMPGWLSSNQPGSPARTSHVYESKKETILALRRMGLHREDYAKNIRLQEFLISSFSHMFLAFLLTCSGGYRIVLGSWVY